MRPRVAVVGLGWMGRDHARILAAHPGVELIYVVDRRADLAQEMAALVTALPATDLADVIDDVDAVSVCTPDAAHEEVALLALRHHRRVFVEKPLATSLSAARRMAAAAWTESALSVGHLLDADPRIERTRLAIAAGKIGELWHARIYRHAGRQIAQNVAENSSVGWFGAVHDADLLLDLTGREARSVRSSGLRGRVTNTWDVIDTTVEMSDGIYATLHESWTLPAGRTNRSVSGLVLIGDMGGLEVNLGHGQVEISSNAGSYAPDTMHYPSEGLRDSSDLQVELDRWVQTLHGAEIGVNAQRGLRAVALVDAIHRSLESGKREQVAQK